MAKAKILVMDDEDLVRNVASKMIDFLGHQAVGARDGAEALRLYAEQQAAGSPFDVVLLDLQVPGGMGGAATLAELLRMDPHVKAIISSGYGENAPGGDALEGHAAIIAKPYELKKLGETLDRILAASHA